MPASDGPEQPEPAAVSDEDWRETERWLDEWTRRGAEPDDAASGAGGPGDPPGPVTADERPEGEGADRGTQEVAPNTWPAGYVPPPSPAVRSRRPTARALRPVQPSTPPGGAGGAACAAARPPPPPPPSSPPDAGLRTVPRTTGASAPASCCSRGSRSPSWPWRPAHCSPSATTASRRSPRSARRPGSTRARRCDRGPAPGRSGPETRSSPATSSRRRPTAR